MVALGVTSTPTSPKPLVYGNWIRVRILWFLGVLTFAWTALALAPLPGWIRIVSALAAFAFAVAFAIPLYAYRAFSRSGGNVQERVYDTLVAALEGERARSILDIGAGNGVLSVKLALAAQGARVTGIDSWGPAWQYARSVCEENARRAGVSERVELVQASAAALPFDDGAFDAVASNLTFHEVRDQPDKLRLVREALRVSRPGGRFAFIDLFYDPSFYGDVSDFKAAIEALGLTSVELVRLSDRMTLPRLLLHPKVLGHAGILRGAK